MQAIPGQCGVCGLPLHSKAIERPASPDVTTRLFCAAEKDDQHDRAADRGWDPYQPAKAPVA
jgi:hypothetical protein